MPRIRPLLAAIPLLLAPVVVAAAPTAAAGPPTAPAGVPNDPVATSLIIDSSGSMSWNDPADRRKEASRAYLTVSLPSDEVGVVDFDGSATLLSDPVPVGPNRAALTAAIDRIDSSGGTDLGRGLQTGCDSLQRATESPRAAIFLTDGDGSYSGQAQCFADAGWKIYTIGLGDGTNESLLTQIANETGGRFLKITNSTDLVCEFQQIRAEIGGGTGGGCQPAGVILPGQTITQTITVGANVVQSTFTTTWPGSDIQMTLTSPAGRVINRSTTAPDAEIAFGDTFETFTIRNPQAGDWNVSLFGADVPAGGEPYTFSVVTFEGPEPPPPPDNPPVVLDRPVIGGAPKVGETLTVSDGLWDTQGLVFAYEWRRDGAAIPGARSKTYQPSVADLGHQISAVVNASAGGGAPGFALADPVTISEGQGAVATTPPSFTGTAKVGKTLTAVDGAWNRAGVSLTRQWLLDGLPVPGATGPTYSLAPTDVGKSVALRVVATQTGYADGTATSGSAIVTEGDAPTTTVLPSVAGSPELGQTLTADPGAWTMPGLAFSFAWLKDGVPLAGATGPTHTVTADDIGHGLAVRVTASQAGYAAGEATSASTSVPKVSSGIEARVAKTRVVAGKKGRVIALVSASGLTPTGMVTVLENGTELASKPPRGRKHKASIRLPRLPRGWHDLVVRYVGDDLTEAAETTVRLKVVKKRR